MRFRLRTLLLVVFLVAVLLAILAFESWTDFQLAPRIDVSLDWSDSDTVIFNVDEAPFEVLTVANSGP